MRFNALIPELSVSELGESLRFYVDTLGFKVEYRRDQDGFAFLSLGGAQLMIEARNGHWETGVLERPFGRGINFQIDVEKVDPMVAALRARGHPLMREPMENWYRVGGRELGQREFLVQDPDGYLLRFAEDLGERAPKG